MVVVYNLYAKTDHLTLSGHQGSHATKESGAMTCRLAKVLNLFMHMCVKDLYLMCRYMYKPLERLLAAF